MERRRDFGGRRSERDNRTPQRRDDRRSDDRRRDDRRFDDRRRDDRRPDDRRRDDRRFDDRRRDDRRFDDRRRDDRRFDDRRRDSRRRDSRPEAGEKIRLNKFIANSGVCSRREADVLIAAGAVSVNGEVITEMGYKVTTNDVVVYGGERLSHERKQYLLLNKPKGYITTVDDPQRRRTVMDLIDGACKERIYPVGRLDRNTSGLLLFTNDGELAKKLTHPSYGAEKVYHVETDKNVTKADLEKLVEGIELEDGVTAVDEAIYSGDGSEKNKIGVKIHSGKNRIIRRLFESMGYDVIKLDRIVFAGLTKRGLPRGNYRFLTDREIGFLQMIQKDRRSY